MKLRRRWTAAVLGMGLVGLLTGALASSAVATANPDPATALRGDCPRWGCGTNHNQVLL